MSRSILSHRYPNDLLLVNPKMKLHLELFHLSHCSSCICGALIDPHGMHTFCCVGVSKKAMHDRVRDDTAPVLCTILKTAGIIGKGSRVDLELKKIQSENFLDCAHSILLSNPVPFFSNELPYLPFCTLAAAVILP